MAGAVNRSLLLAEIRAAFFRTEHAARTDRVGRIRQTCKPKRREEERVLAACPGSGH